MAPSQPAAHQRLAIEAELDAGDYRFVRERLRLPLGLEASFGWLRHPPSVMVVPRLADGRLLVARHYRPAVGRWVLEFPSGPLWGEESPAAGGARLLRRLTGHGATDWQSLGALRPNPGYSDERMVLGLMALEVGWAEPAEGMEGGTDGEGGKGYSSPWPWTIQELEHALASLDEAVDGRTVSAWFLARRRGAL